MPTEFQRESCRLKAMHGPLTTDIASEYAQRLAAALGGELLRVSLFGSRARGEGRTRSYFDLMARATDAARLAPRSARRNTECIDAVLLSPFRVRADAGAGQAVPSPEGRGA